MKVFKEFVNMDAYKFKAKVFMSSTQKENEEYLTVHPHWHDEIELLHVLSGNAFQQVNENIFNIEKGDTVVIRGQDVHATYTLTPEDMDILVVQFDSCIIGGQNDIVNSMIKDFNTNTAIPYPINQETEFGLALSGLIMNIYRESISNNPARELFIIASCASLLGLCLRSCPAKSNHLQNSQNIKKALGEIFIAIDENYQRPISLKEAAGLSNFSIPHFCRLFRQTVGMSFVDYLNHYRVNKSIQFLKSDKTITEIASLSGFGSINSYIRTFKKYNHLSPNEYRRAMVDK